MCLKETELDKILRRLEESTAAIESRLSKLEEGHDSAPKWLHEALLPDQIVGHPVFLRQIDRLRDRLADLDVRLMRLEELHPEVLIDQQLEAARHG
jgi:hypothetical protein